ncbi:MAG: DUF4340 domain-containing protein [Roseburia sp.]|nr:DUF4340 domain-containing protein [Roseburia sp.]
MNKSKIIRLYILLGVLVVACIATFAISRHEEEKELIKNSDKIILTLDSDSVTALSWEYDDTTLSFHKDETWLYDDDEAFPVDDEKIAALLEQFQEFGVSFIIEEVTDYSQYGLDEPTCTISITAGEEIYEIELGAYSTMDSKRYVSIGDGNVYLVTDDPMENYEVEISDLIKHDEIPDLSDATGIQFAGTENYEIIYEEESTNTYCADDVYFTDNKPLDTSTVGDYLDTIDSLSLTDYVSYNATEEELQAFGLDTPDLTVTVDYPVENEDGELITKTFVLNIGRNQEELAEALESEDEDAEYNVTAYARVGDSQIVYQITSLNYTNLTAVAYDDLRHKEVLTASFDDIYQIDITLEDTDYSLTTTEDEDGTTTWHYTEDEELNISGLKSAINALEADSFTEEEATQKEEISMTVYLNNENYPEIHIAFYRYDGENCLAVVDGQSVSFVSRSYVVDLIEAVNSIVLN